LDGFRGWGEGAIARAKLGAEGAGWKENGTTKSLPPQKVTGGGCRFHFLGQPNRGNYMSVMVSADDETTIEEVFRCERRHTLSTPLYKYGRYPTLILALLFVAKGAHDLVVGWASDLRDHWTVHFTNWRWLLALHLCFAGPFLLAAWAQLVLIPWVGEDSTGARAAVHRWLGRGTVITGAAAAATALALCPRALLGTGWIFGPWSLLWLVAAIMTWLRARQRRFEYHRWWAKLLTQSALFFLTGRMAMWMCIKLGVASTHDIYFYSMAVAAAIACWRAYTDAAGHKHAMIGRKAAKHWRSAGHKAALLQRLAAVKKD